MLAERLAQAALLESRRPPTALLRLRAPSAPFHRGYMPVPWSSASCVGKPVHRDVEGCGAHSMRILIPNQQAHGTVGLQIICLLALVRQHARTLLGSEHQQPSPGIWPWACRTRANTVKLSDSMEALLRPAMVADVESCGSGGGSVLTERNPELCLPEHCSRAQARLLRERYTPCWLPRDPGLAVRRPGWSVGPRTVSSTRNHA